MAFVKYKVVDCINETQMSLLLFLLVSVKNFKMYSFRGVKLEGKDILLILLTATAKEVLTNN